MTANVLMFQGTGSDVGKSTLVAGICRIATRRGISVAPFKPQNMSNNAAACPDGGEIGRAQALQARAAGLLPTADFNPVLLKPQSDCSAQIVVHGQVLDTISASEYMNKKRQHLLDAVETSFKRLSNSYDLVLVEGAGSAAETNLRSKDIANMGFAQRVQAPVCLIGDIDRGGVIAAIVGTKNVIDNADAALIKSCIINRFRGDPSLFDDGVKAIEALSAWPCRGVVPWLPAALRLPQEDAVVLEESTAKGAGNVRIAVPLLSRIANFDDLDPLSLEPNVDIGYVKPGSPIPHDVDAIILPGTKSTMGDMQFLREQGWHHDIIAFARRGGHVTGICGGFQLLGLKISDPQGSDGAAGSIEGLGLLDIITVMSDKKQIREISGTCTQSGASLRGYEIHVGETSGNDIRRPMTILDGMPDGAINLSGTVQGTYLHGIFNNDKYRNYDAVVDQELDNLADGLEDSIDIEALLNDAAQPSFNVDSMSST